MNLKRVLIIAWAYPGFASPGVVALSKRIEQIARELAARGYIVDVLFRNEIDVQRKNGEEIKSGNDKIRLYPFQFNGEEIKHSKSSIIRKITTLKNQAFWGDITTRWARKVHLSLEQNDILKKPDVMIAFFTPRGPLWLANKLSKEWNVPWIADLQDTYDEGVANLSYLTRRWMHRTLRGASSIVHVSPEWAARDGQKIKLDIVTGRHGVPILAEPPQPNEPKSVFKLLYTGNVSPVKQPINELIDALEKLNHKGHKFILEMACTKESFDNLGLHQHGFIKCLGWLSSVELKAKITECNCLVIFGWAQGPRQVVPSKLYEYLAYNRPILFSGYDTGSIAILLNELKHPQVVHKTSGEVADALLKLKTGDTSKVFTHDKMKGSLFTVQDLGKMYDGLIKKAL